VYAEKPLAPLARRPHNRLPPLDIVDMQVQVGPADPAVLLATEEEVVASLGVPRDVCGWSVRTVRPRATPS
jgi:hypothetical protein